MAQRTITVQIVVSGIPEGVTNEQIEESLNKLVAVGLADARDTLEDVDIDLDELTEIATAVEFSDAKVVA